MAELTERLIVSGATSVILISPHAPLESDSFVAYDGAGSLWRLRQLSLTGNECRRPSRSRITRCDYERGRR